MSFQSELWVILKDEEEQIVWDKVKYNFGFSPSVKDNHTTFKFDIPFDVYDISNSPIYSDNANINEIIKTSFIQCMDNDDFMYALDWQHTCFRYNPRTNNVIKYPVFMPNESYCGGGNNVYFPEFYPNGDYYLFIAKDFRWGYLTHPWQKKVWIYGNKLMGLIKKYTNTLGFIQCSK